MAHLMMTSAHVLCVPHVKKKNMLGGPNALESDVLIKGRYCRSRHWRWCEVKCPCLHMRQEGRVVVAARSYLAALGRRARCVGACLSHRSTTQCV